ncbi:hypothetical protein [Sphingomonas bacterium]|uniref:hypothetical protein n=1 Tax=Sphingomonas bacterium TaxID=1895847 RepID=UPI002602EB45|nr:hypothetical protein [Sphingomonas bacterium]MDB5678472.1 hypothetical protein [Sphingomonas bacterium]
MTSKPVLTRFPFINLTKSLERARAIYENDKGGKGLKMPVAFSAWGYSDKSSGGFQTVAALKSYGLLEDEGANDDRSVKLTTDARQYFQTEIEEDQERLRAKFAGRPPLMAHLLDHWERGTVADPVARTHLKTGIGLNEQSARSALGIYKDNLSFVIDKGSAKATEVEPNRDEVRKDGGGDSGSVISPKPPRDVKVGDRVQWVSQDTEQFDLPRVVTEVFCDPVRGWFVSVRGEKGSLPMEQIEVVERGASQQRADPATPADTSAKQPIEVFLTAGGRLQITADVDRLGVDTLIDMLEKYKPILELVGSKPN